MTYAIVLSGRESALATSKESAVVFEQQIQRIYDLVSEPGAQVTWNDHLPDPDNPTQSRQIDVTIKRAGLLTLVECRRHKSRQDVQWIEELIGRQTSLGAHAVIGVSSSGFTAGALAKASKHGIILRDLDKLTDPEVASWSRRVALTLFFYKYSELEVSLLFDHDRIRSVISEQLQTELRTHPCIQSLFNAAAQTLSGSNLTIDEQLGRVMQFGLTVEFDGVQFCDLSLRQANFAGKACLVAQHISPTIRYSYGEPKAPFTGRDTVIETFPSLGATSITHNAGRISTLLDLSELTVEPYHQFRFWRQDAGEELDHEVLEVQLGRNFEQLKVSGKGLKVKMLSNQR
jgi:restriction endonuclease